MATISNKPPHLVELGEYILIYDDDTDHDGEAGTYDEAAFDKYETAVLRSVAYRLSERRGEEWEAGTNSDHDGGYVVARRVESYN